MNHCMRALGLLMAVSFLFNTCADLSSDSASEEALTTSVKRLWDAKLDADWGAVYDMTVKAYKEKIEKTAFMASPKINLIDYAIQEVDILEPGRKAVSVVTYTNDQSGFQFQANHHEDEWVWEEGAWHLNLQPLTATAPFGEKKEEQ